MPTVETKGEAAGPFSWIRRTKGDKKHHQETGYTRGMKYINDNLIGNHALIKGPFGERRMVYADYTASGRLLYNIENYLSKFVLSYYGNTHTTTSLASIQTDKFRQESKEIIRKCMNASEDDAVIFCGSGTTAAIHKLIAVIGLTDSRIAQNTVVFIGPYEHHSNMLPWKETGAKLVRIRENKRGQLDTQHLLQELNRHIDPHYTLKVGTFSSCSNVTGLLCDTIAITQLLHVYGVLAFWDYASGAAYMKIDMNPVTSGNEANAFKDAIFCSPHKLVGGPGSPGLLIAKKKIFRNHIPHGQGGGTVVFVTNSKHKYLQDIEAREEGGTPGIVESIRAGLAFQLKQHIGTGDIHKREEYLVCKGISALHANPNILLLGSKSSPRLPIFSFVIRHPTVKKLIHHNFVSLLLSDLFGVQARGGCACAGPYAQDLLGIHEDLAEGFLWFLDAEIRQNSIIPSPSLRADVKQIQEQDRSFQIASSLQIMKPGFTRINLSYFMTDEEVDYILSAINIVASEGWKLLPQYVCDAVRGSWSHRKNNPHYKLMSLHDIVYTCKSETSMAIGGTVHERAKDSKSNLFSDTMVAAKKIIGQAEHDGSQVFPFDEMTLKDYLPNELLHYIWFLESHKAMLLLSEKSSESIAILQTESIPFKPREESGPAIANTADNRPVTKKSQKRKVSSDSLLQQDKNPAANIELSRTSCKSAVPHQAKESAKVNEWLRHVASQEPSRQTHRTEDQNAQHRSTSTHHYHLDRKKRVKKELSTVNHLHSSKKESVDRSYREGSELRKESGSSRRLNSKGQVINKASGHRSHDKQTRVG